MVRILRVRKVITVSWLFLAVSFCAGQTVKNGADQKSKPDFSGTWVLDNSKGVKRNYDLTLIIVHRGAGDQNHQKDRGQWRRAYRGVDILHGWQGRVGFKKGLLG